MNTVWELKWWLNDKVIDRAPRVKRFASRSDALQYALGLGRRVRLELDEVLVIEEEGL
jgi:hypothetical protein